VDAGTKLQSDAQKWLQRANRTLCAIIDRYARAQAIAHDTYRDDYVTNDFFYYCLTKSTKSLIAINVLLENGLGEDAQILLRSVYESYLAISFLSANPGRVDDLVDRKVGVFAGRYLHPLTSKGKKDRRKIIDPRSGEILPFDVPIAEMAAKSKHSEDESIHWPLYAFLSEHCHPNFVASGNYRANNEIYYTYRSRFQLLQAGIYGVYVVALMLAEVKEFEKLRGAELRQTSALLRSSTRLLLSAFSQIAFIGSMKGMPAAMQTRIAKHFGKAGSNPDVQPTPNARG
jgi:hypothetical protein